MAAGAVTAVVMNQMKDEPGLGKHKRVSDRHKGVKDEIDIVGIRHDNFMSY